MIPDLNTVNIVIIIASVRAFTGISDVTNNDALAYSLETAVSLIMYRCKTALEMNGQNERIYLPLLLRPLTPSFDDFVLFIFSLVKAKFILVAASVLNRYIC